jgi:Bacterial Ig-like domain
MKVAFRDLALPVALGAASLLACSDSGGPNTEQSFRIVLMEPTVASLNVACNDTIRVTFNHPIDTTAVYDDEVPRYFIATIDPSNSVIFDAAGVTLSNPELDANDQPIPGTNRTLNLPFEFAPGTNYTFNFDIARDTSGRELETRGSTTFQTAPGAPGCP